MKKRGLWVFGSKPNAPLNDYQWSLEGNATKKITVPEESLKVELDVLANQFRDQYKAYVVCELNPNRINISSTQRLYDCR